jgi:hypothetical protein
MDVTGFLIIAFIFLTPVGAGTCAVFYYHRFLSKRYDIPGPLPVLMQIARGGDDVSSVKVIVPRVRRALAGQCTRTVSGKDRVNPVHTIRMAAEDIDALGDSIGLTAFVQDYADAYSSHAASRNWEGDLSAVLEVYVVADAGCWPNHPLISAVRPRRPQAPMLVRPNKAESFDLNEPDPQEWNRPGACLPDRKVRSATASPPRYEVATRPYSTDPDLTRPVRAPRRDKADPLRSLVKDGRTLIRMDTRSILLVGRHPDCDVVIPDLTVSGQHASIEECPDGWMLRPKEGRICRVNDVRTVEPTLLSDGDVLGFGESEETIEFRC